MRDERKLIEADFKAADTVLARLRTGPLAQGPGFQPIVSAWRRRVRFHAELIRLRVELLLTPVRSNFLQFPASG